jgi:hypothetical protein
MRDLPGWFIHRAQTAGASRAWIILAPLSERSSAIYLLDIGSTFELHCVDDASSGIDGVTIPMTRREASAMMSSLVGALGGRSAGIGFGRGRMEVAIPPAPASAATRELTTTLDEVPGE